ncbi:MAG: hypothetical protein IT581_20200 [Verrucomicrobiales bacterium]|nr:hypothetical protein [Verrucomicrobiales bacterium]
MARNRRLTNLTGITSAVTSGVMICLAVAVSLLGYIRLKGELSRLDTDINRLDRQLAELRRFNNKLEMDYAMIVSPSGLNNRLREMRLILVMPGDNARVVLPEPSGENAAEPAVGSRPLHAVSPGSFRRSTSPMTVRQP